MNDQASLSAGGMRSASERRQEIIAAKDRLQPALLDRLTDRDPTRRTETAEAVFVSESRLRDALMRDLGWLLNACNADDHAALDDFPYAQRSVINYGIPPLSGQLLSELDWKNIEQGIRESILAFEPRILPQTLKVNMLPSLDLLNHHNTLQFEIRCQFWSLPFPQELLLKTSLDLETGLVTLKNLRA